MSPNSTYYNMLVIVTKAMHYIILFFIYLQARVLTLILTIIVSHNYFTVRYFIETLLNSLLWMVDGIKTLHYN